MKYGFLFNRLIPILIVSTSIFVGVKIDYALNHVYSIIIYPSLMLLTIVAIHQMSYSSLKKEEVVS